MLHILIWAWVLAAEFLSLQTAEGRNCCVHPENEVSALQLHFSQILTGLQQFCHVFVM